MSETVSDIVECVSLFDSQHPPSDAVAKRVGRYIFSLASPREAVRANASATSGPLDDVVDPLPGHPTSFLARDQGGIAVDAGLEELSKRCDGPQRAAPIEFKGNGRRGTVVWVVLLD